MAGDPETLRTFAFGDSTAWGAGLFPGTGAEGALVIADAGGTAVCAARLEAVADPDGDWRVSGDGLELAVTGAGVAAPVLTAGELEVPSGFEQRCAVSGVAADGRPLAGPGVRGERRDAGPLASSDSVRVVLAWFGEAVGAGVVAVRPRKAKGHGSDVWTAATLSPDGAPPVADVRLSTTYRADGRPSRAGVELWSADPEAYPRRLAAEARGAGASGRAGGWAVMAELLDAHLRGEEGIGVYLLARRA